MQQWQKAAETYTRILDRQKELNATNTTPALASLLEMAKWRLDYIAWLQKAKMNNLALLPPPSTNPPPVRSGTEIETINHPTPTPMNQDLVEELNTHLAVCRELLAIAEGEAQALRRADQPSLFEFCQLKKNLLPRLNETLDSLRKHRVRWQSLSSDERARQAEIGPLLRRNQDVAMKFILLDRENEQGLLRRGLVPPRATALGQPAAPAFRRRTLPPPKRAMSFLRHAD